MSIIVQMANGAFSQVLEESAVVFWGEKMSLRPFETIQLTQFYFRVIMKAYIVLLYGKQEWKFNIY